MEDFEQKYNELVEAARAVVEANPGLSKIDKEIGRLSKLLPEKESEDERIRKALLAHFSRYRPDEVFLNIPMERIVAWLEKQKEQKPVKLNDDTEVGLDRALQIVKHAKGNLCCYQSDDGIYECDHAIQTLEHILKNGIEQKPAGASEEDKKG